MRTPHSKVAKWVAAVAVVVLGVTAGSLTGAGAAMSKSIPPSPPFFTPGPCGPQGSGPNDTANCNAAILTALNHARAATGMSALGGSFSLAGFDSLTADEQIFAIADIERTDRGLPAIAGLTAQLNAVALSGAEDQGDPSISLPFNFSGGGQARTYGSNWAEGTANAMGADYYWMYDDGLDSPNVACTTRDESQCWGHRDNILTDYNDNCPSGEVNAVMGVAETDSGTYRPSIAEIFTNDCGPLAPMEFTWADVQRQVLGITPPPPPPPRPPAKKSPRPRPSTQPSSAQASSSVASSSPSTPHPATSQAHRRAVHRKSPAHKGNAAVSRPVAGSVKYKAT